MVGADEGLRYQHLIPQILLKDMKELELEVVTRGIKDICAAIVAESEILEEMKLKQMEDPQTQEDSWQPHNETKFGFKMMDSVFKF